MSLSFSTLDGPAPQARSRRTRLKFSGQAGPRSSAVPDAHGVRCAWPAG
jgi:hypothetical protein